MQLCEKQHQKPIKEEQEGYQGSYGLSMMNHFFFFFDFPALLIAMATACFCGLPAWTSVEIFSLITFFDLPDLRGMEIYSACFSSKNALEVSSLCLHWKPSLSPM